jgi:hypothetical protein
MSQPRGFGLNGKSSYENVAKPMIVNCNFVVDSTNGNGLGIRSLKSNGYIHNVFMHTSASPGSNNGQLNPNPALGYALVQFKNNFNYYLGGFDGEIAPLASSNLTSVTAGSAYVITSLGTTTLAQWQTAGLIAGLVPAVGQAFIAAESSSIGGTGTVGAPGVPTTHKVMVVGDPNQSIANSNISQNAGAIIILQFSAPTNSSTTTLVAANPADGSTVGLCFRFDGSSVSIPDSPGVSGL